MAARAACSAAPSPAAASALGKAAERQQPNEAKTLKIDVGLQVVGGLFLTVAFVGAFCMIQIFSGPSLRSRNFDYVGAEKRARSVADLGHAPEPSAFSSSVKSLFKLRNPLRRR